MNKILIIDDDKQMRLFMEASLKKAGYDVTSAPDGAVGLNVFKEQVFDLVICDLLMPEKEGLETIGDLVKLKPDLKIIAVSGGSRITTFSFLPIAKHLGAQKALSKPFSRDELLNAVSELLNTK